MPHSPRDWFRHRLPCHGLLIVLALAAGCQSTKRTPIQQAHDAYDEKQFEESYQLAAPLAAGPSGSHEAAYLAGMSSYRLGRKQDAERYLLRAAQSTDQSLVGAASAQLGLMYAAKEQYEQAAAALLRAAVRLKGPDRANAYFHAGIAQQRLGQWVEAKDTLAMARRATADTAFQEKIDRHLRTTGWTVQVGAYSDQSNAQRAADLVAPRAKLLKLGTPRLVVAQNAQGRRLVLVQVGRFTSHASGDIARKRLGQADALIAPVAQ